MIKIILKSLFKKPVTISYPKKDKENHEIVRGTLGIDIEKCIFCGNCTRKCPSDCITVEKQKKTWRINRFDCVVCGYCTENCPTKCLALCNTLPNPEEKMVEEVFVQEEKHVSEDKPSKDKQPLETLSQNNPKPPKEKQQKTAKNKKKSSVKK